MRGDRERESQIHAGGIMFGRRVDKLFEFRKRHDLVELAVDFIAAHAKDRSAEVDILTAGQLRMETGADLQQGTHAPVHAGTTDGWFGDAGEDFQKRALAGAIATDYAASFAPLNVKRNIMQ